LSVENGDVQASADVSVLCVGATNFNDGSVRLELDHVRDESFDSLTVRPFKNDRLTLTASE
jgi:hypothetical protein